MTEIRADGGSRADTASRTASRIFDPEELRRRNAVAVGMDLLYLTTTGVFAHMFARGFWPAVIAAIPMAAFLYFGWHSSKAFFVAQVLTIVATVAATLAGVLSV